MRPHSGARRGLGAIIHGGSRRIPASDRPAAREEPGNLLGAAGQSKQERPVVRKR